MSDTYDDILKARPPRGRVKNGEIEVVPEARLPPSEERHGIVFQNKHLTLINDPVLFSDYGSGSYLRFFQGEADQKIFGVSLFVVRPNSDGELDAVWVTQWRHAQDAWMSEFPRGCMRAGESPLEGAMRELQQETGLKDPDLMIYLGNVADNSGLSSNITACFLCAYMGHPRLIQREKESTEAIERVQWHSLDRWRDIVFRSPVEGRPVGPVDLFSMGAFGLACITQYLDRVKHCLTYTYDQGYQRNPRVSTALRRELEKRSPRFGLRVECVSEAVKQRFLQELPALAEHPSPAAEIHIPEASELLLSWFSSTSSKHVIAIDKL